MTNSIIHRAGWVIIDPWTIFRNGFVKVDSGLIKEVGHGREHGEAQVVDHGPGALLPVLVNTHTHLELSTLRGKIPFEKGFLNWVNNLIRHREALSSEALILGANKGIQELLKSGCGVAGEISTLGLTWEAFSTSALAGVWFRESLGDTLSDNVTCGVKNEKNIMSLAGHAPHTTAPEVLVNIKKIAKNMNLPFSIHIAESEDEDRFLKTGKGEWADLLTERGIDFSGWGLPVESPVKHLLRLGLLDEKTIAVHLVYTDQNDLKILMDCNVHVCLCLRSNRNIHNRLPDLAGMLGSGINLCLGTDSLASTESLSMFEEMAYASSAFPFVPPEVILAMATINGAKALGVEDRYGSLVPGKNGAFVYVPVNASSRANLLETLVNSDFDVPCKTQI